MHSHRLHSHAPSSNLNLIKFVLKPGFHMIATIARVVSIYDRNDRNDRKSGFHIVTIAMIAAIVARIVDSFLWYGLAHASYECQLSD